MRTQLRGAPVPPAVQEAHDTRSGRVVAVVLALLALYAYAFTQVARPLRLPPPQDLAESAGVSIDHVWDDDRNVDSELYVPKTRRHGGDDERLFVFAALAGAFLSVYFLPLRFKKPSIVFWFLAAFLALYGPEAAAGLLALHLAVYLSFHPEGRRRGALAGLVGALLYVFLLSDPRRGWAMSAGGAAAAAAGAFFGWGLLRPLLRRERFASVWRLLVVQSPMIVGLSGAAFERVGGREWEIPLGLLLFFWHWQRLMVYSMDFKEGEIPKDLPVFEYLSLFLTPGCLPNWTYVQYIGQGYLYLSSRFLCEDKNKTVLSGVKILAVAFLYLVLGRWFLVQAAGALERLFDVKVYRYVIELIGAYRNRHELTMATVLLSTLLDQIRMFLTFGAVAHFRVGAWRLLGYRVDPQYDRFWLSTNLVSLWGRWAFHYREFLVRCFYYPTFFGFFRKKGLKTRVFLATLVATALGNQLWGHLPERFFLFGLGWNDLIDVLRRWPYFLLLGGGISLTQVFLMRKGRTRRPWTWDRWILLDVLCAYLTFQFFALIHVFARPRQDLTTWDMTRLFLKGFGLDLGGPG